jgi:hypothetical protein
MLEKKVVIREKDPASKPMIVLMPNGVSREVRGFRQRGPSPAMLGAEQNQPIAAWRQSRIQNPAFEPLTDFKLIPLQIPMDDANLLGGASPQHNADRSGTGEGSR